MENRFLKKIARKSDDCRASIKSGISHGKSIFGVAVLRNV